MTENTTLTSRETEILALLAEGKSNKEIAAELFISINTVKVHVSNIFQKIEVSSRTEATLYAIENGFSLQTRISDLPEGLSTSASSDNLKASKPTPAQNQLIMIILIVMTVIGVAIFAIIRSANSNESAIRAEFSDRRWVHMEDLPSPRSQAAAITYNSQIYLIGGFADGKTLNDVHVFDIQTNSWEELASKPTPVREANAVVLNDRIYVPGGITDSGESTSLVEIYSPENDSWAQVASLPQPLSSYALEVFEGKLYIFGGINESGIKNQVYSYDPAIDRWSEEQPMSQERASLDSTLWGGRIYLVGGSDGVEDLTLVESYAPSSLPDSESSFRDELYLPEPAVKCKTDQLVDTLFVICPSKVIKLSPDRTEWISEHNPEGFVFGSDFSVAYFNNSLYILGGNNASGESESFFARFQALYSIMLPMLTND